MALVSGSNPTILQIIPRLDTGGAELTTIEMSDAIVRAGGRAIVATEGGRMADAVAHAGGKLVTLPAGTKNPLGMLANVRRLVEVIRAEGVDLVHARSRAPAWSALRAARVTGVPFVTTYHGAYAESGRFKRLYNSVMARGDIVIANSRFTADLVIGRYGTAPDRIRVIHRGVDAARFDPAAVSAERLAATRHAWGVSEGARVVLQAARLTSWKGQAVTIGAARALAGSGWPDDVVFILAGDDQGRSDYRQSLLDAIAGAGLEARVRLTGHCADMPAAFALAHVAVIASTEPEAFGRTSTEAQAMGCPVIATDIGAPPETILADGRDDAEAAGGGTGWLVPPGDAAQLASAIATALRLAPAARGQMSTRARARVLETFTLEAMQERTLAVYDDLIGSALAKTFTT